jgi:hypothetical protein
MKRQSDACWDARQQKLALLLASGYRVKEAATEAGIAERTAYAWMEKQGFDTLISDFRRRMLDAALGRLTDAMTSAVDTLRGLLGGDHPDSVRLGAAKAILSSIVDIQAHAELVERIYNL